MAITGLGPVTPLGIGRDAFWAAALDGRSATRALDALPGGFSTTAFSSRVVARVDDGELEDHAALPYEDRRLTLAELATRLALADAGLPRDLSTFDCGIVLGNAVGAPLIVEQEFLETRLAAAPRRHDAALLDHLSFHTPASLLADRYRLTGPELTVSTGCTAGLDAAGTAFEMVANGHCDLMLAGSAEAPLTPVVFSAFDRIGALSSRNHDPEGASRPFDRERDGFVLAEGATVLVLEELEHARARGATVYAEIESFVSVSNGYHMTNLPADGEVLGRCLAACLERAGCDPSTVDHVNAHGSSTPQNDLCETNAVKSVFGERSAEVTVNSLKSMIGHALGASNAIEIAACALSLRDQIVHPTVNLTVAGEGCDLDYVPRSARRRPLWRMAKLSSGFSGIHSSMLLARARVAA